MSENPIFLTAEFVAVSVTVLGIRDGVIGDFREPVLGQFSIYFFETRRDCGQGCQNEHIQAPSKSEMV